MWFNNDFLKFISDCNYFSLSAFAISRMTVSLGMHNQTANDAKQIRRVTRVVYHIDYNRHTLVISIAGLFFDC
jgi:hypothetical protein